jgi:hypothetical protein
LIAYVKPNLKKFWAIGGDREKGSNKIKEKEASESELYYNLSKKDRIKILKKLTNINLINGK